MRYGLGIGKIDRCWAVRWRLKTTAAELGSLASSFLFVFCFSGSFFISCSISFLSFQFFSSLSFQCRRRLGARHGSTAVAAGNLVLQTADRDGLGDGFGMVAERYRRHGLLGIEVVV